MPEDAVATNVPLQPLPAPSTTIDTLVNGTLLETVWRREIRSRLRTIKFNGLYLAADAAQYAAYEWGLGPFLERLKADIRDGSYSPESADIVRGAKGRGLSRPLAYLAPRDALVYQAIITRALPDLVKELRPWTGAHLGDRTNEVSLPSTSQTPGPVSDQVTRTIDATRARRNKHPPSRLATDYGNFFEQWMAKQGVLYKIIRTEPFIVESDVANYFSSIDLRIVHEYLSRSDLDRDVVRLALYVIRNVLRHPQYADSPGMGLPQESMDSSRHIAHGLLTEVDREFDDRGQRGLYGRFMDDFVIGASSLQDGQELIAALQTRLEALGLYPNPAKTRIFRSDEYRQRVMADENAYLDYIDGLLVEEQSNGVRSRRLPDEETRQEFYERASAFRANDEKPALWERVLRRYYRYLRELGNDMWLRFLKEDLEEYPDGAGYFLEYMRSFPINRSSVSSLFGVCSNTLSLYGDVPLLLLEAVATAPSSSQDTGVRDDIVFRVKDLCSAITADGVVSRSRNDWIAAYCAPIMAKYATREGLATWVDSLSLRRRAAQSVMQLHIAPIQVSLGVSSRQLYDSELAGLSWSRVLSLDFIRALENNDSRARGVVLGLANADVRLLPNRHIVHPRVLPLLRIIGASPNRRDGKALGHARLRLERNEPRLRDELMVAEIRQVEEQLLGRVVDCLLRAPRAPSQSVVMKVRAVGRWPRRRLDTTDADRTATVVF